MRHIEVIDPGRVAEFAELMETLTPRQRVAFDHGLVALKPGWERRKRERDPKKPWTKGMCTACPRMVKKKEQARVGNIRLGSLHKWHLQRVVLDDGTVAYRMPGGGIIRGRSKPKDAPPSGFAWFDPERLVRFAEEAATAGLTRRQKLAMKFRESSR
jgi:hypothetical protein